MATNTTRMNVKLLVDNKSQKVVFAECGKDFVDFLFSIFILPLGSVAEVLARESMVGDVGAMGQLLKSLKDMNEAYILPGLQKPALLQPKVLSNINKPLLLQIENVVVGRKYYICSNYHNSSSSYSSSRCGYVSDIDNAICPECKEKIWKVVSYVGASYSGGEEGGFVKAMATYMVTDDLVVTPVSPISAITLLNKFDIKEVGALEEKVVVVGRAEGLALLKASLQSKTVLTDVFLGKPTKEDNKKAPVLNSNKDELHVLA